jgi:hypothetical protein
LVRTRSGDSIDQRAARKECTHDNTHVYKKQIQDKEGGEGVTLKQCPGENKPQNKNLRIPFLKHPLLGPPPNSGGSTLHTLHFSILNSPALHFIC